MIQREELRRVCPWCGIPTLLHDMTTPGAACRWRIAKARFAATVRIAWRKGWNR